MLINPNNCGGMMMGANSNHNNHNGMMLGVGGPCQEIGIIANILRTLSLSFIGLERLLRL